MKSAQALGIPAAACIASWDHLTTKGLIRVRPGSGHRVESRTAGRGRGIPRHRSGAHRRHRRAAVRSMVRARRRPLARSSAGRSACRPIDRSCCSSARLHRSLPRKRSSTSCAAGSAALRAEPALADVGILVRPHPYNSTHWLDADFSDLPNVAIYPRGANPVNEADRQDYFDSLYPQRRRRRREHHGDDRSGDRRPDGSLGAGAGVPGHAGRHAALPVSAGRERRLPESGAVASRSMRGRWPRRFRRRRSATPRARASSSDSCGRTARDVPATPLLVDALEQTGAVEAAAGDRSASMLLPLQALLRFAGLA